MMTHRHLCHLGTSTIQEKHNKTSVPELVFEQELLKCDRIAHWGIEAATGYLTVSRDEDYMCEETQYMNGTSISPHRVAIVPKPLFPDANDVVVQVKKQVGERLDDDQLLRYGERYHWVATCEMVSGDHPRVWVLNEEEWNDEWERWTATGDD